MKKRLISLFLMLSMVMTLVISVDAKIIDNEIHEQNCKMIPYVYRSIQWNSYNYFLAHFNIHELFNVDNLEEGFNNSLSSLLYNNRKEEAAASTACIKLLDGLFNFDGEFTQQDLYDTILINMLLDGASAKVSESKEEVKEMVSLLDNINDSVVEIVDAAGVVTKLLTFYEAVKEYGASVDFWDLICTKIANNQSAKELVLHVKGVRLKMDGTPITNLLKKIGKGKITKETISDVFEILEYGFSVVDEVEEYNIKLSNAFLIQASVSDSAVLLLTEMKNATTDIFLDTAIDKYINLIETDSLASFKKAIVASGTAEATTKVLVTYFRTHVLSKFPVYNAGKCVFALVDLFGNFSKKAEMVYVLECLNIVDQAVVSAMRTIENSCTNNELSENSVKFCDSYIDGMLMSYRLQSLELQYGKEYMTVWCGKRNSINI